MKGTPSMPRRRSPAAMRCTRRHRCRAPAHSRTSSRRSPQAAARSAKCRVADVAPLLEVRGEQRVSERAHARSGLWPWAWARVEQAVRGERVRARGDALEGVLQPVAGGSSRTLVQHRLLHRTARTLRKARAVGLARGGCPVS